MVLSCELPIFPCNGEIVQHVNLPWNRQIAACASAMKLSNCSTAWYRRIVELSNYSMGHLPWNFQVAASDKRFKLHFWPIIRLHAPNDKFVGKQFSDRTIRRRADFNDSWIAVLRGFKPFQANRELKRFGFNDSSIAALRGFKPCQANPPRAERQIRRCKRFSDWNDSPPASPCRGFKPCQANHELKRFGFVPSACRMTILRVPNDKFVDVNDSQIETIRLPASPRRFQQFVDCRPPVPNDPVCDSRVFLALEYILGDVPLVSRAKL